MLTECSPSDLPPADRKPGGCQASDGGSRGPDRDANWETETRDSLCLARLCPRVRWAGEADKKYNTTLGYFPGYNKKKNYQKIYHKDN